ncbi:MAG: hypothetical protein WDO16_14620 [Bacteroidota bacterium]
MAKNIIKGPSLPISILTTGGSNKQTYHIEIGTDEVIEYEPGDTIGIVPANRQEVVERIVSLTGIDPLMEIVTTKITAPVNELLTRHLNICYLLTSAIKKYAVITQQDIPDTRMDPGGSAEDLSCQKCGSVHRGGQSINADSATVIFRVFFTGGTWGK